MANPSNPTIANRDAKFTRGEKCIFFHVIITFVLILLLSIIYFIHLYFIKHSAKSVLSISRRVRPFPVDTTKPNLLHAIGILYLKTSPKRLLCNTLLISPKWSLAPGHCVSMRSDPDFFTLMPKWRISYNSSEFAYEETGIKRNIVHPHFDRDQLNNNIGLFEHDTSVSTYGYDVSGMFAVVDDYLHRFSNDMTVVGWSRIDYNNSGDRFVMRFTNVNAITTEKCMEYMSPILELRSHEMCVFVKKVPRNDLEHGAMLVMNSKILGFFSWGDKQGKGIPLVILKIENYQHWLKDIFTLH